MPLIHYYGPNLYFMASSALFLDEEALKIWSYSVVDKGRLTTNLNHNIYEVVEGMNPLVREEKNNVTHMNSRIKIIQLGSCKVMQENIIILKLVSL